MITKTWLSPSGERRPTCCQRPWIDTRWWCTCSRQWLPSRSCVASGVSASTSTTSRNNEKAKRDHEDLSHEQLTPTGHHRENSAGGSPHRRGLAADRARQPGRSRRFGLRLLLSRGGAYRSSRRRGLYQSGSPNALALLPSSVRDGVFQSVPTPQPGRCRCCVGPRQPLPARCLPSPAWP